MFTTILGNVKQRRRDFPPWFGFPSYSHNYFSSIYLLNNIMFKYIYTHLNQQYYLKDIYIDEKLLCVYGGKPKNKINEIGGKKIYNKMLFER